MLEKPYQIFCSTAVFETAMASLTHHNATLAALCSAHPLRPARLDHTCPPPCPGPSADPRRARLHRFRIFYPARRTDLTFRYHHDGPPAAQRYRACRIPRCNAPRGATRCKGAQGSSKSSAPRAKCILRPRRVAPRRGRALTFPRQWKSAPRGA